jgi:hypothetical protein
MERRVRAQGLGLRAEEQTLYLLDADQVEHRSVFERYLEIKIILHVSGGLLN